MSKPTLDSLATAKAKLEMELRQIEEQEVQLRQQQAAEAFADVIARVEQYCEYFSAKQKAELVAAIGSSSVRRPKAAASSQRVPKYWLPHTQETWSGRGRPPRSFTAWKGTAAYNQWKANHPDEKFPKFPG